MTRMLIAAVAGLLLGACATPLPQSPPAGLPGTVSSAAPKAGSTWRYAVSDGFTRLPRGSVEYRVSDVLFDSMTVEVKGYDGERAETYTHGWNWLVRPATNMQAFVYKPAYEALPYPMTAGKTWRHTGTATDPASGKSFPVRIDGEVLGWEKVRVPAGEFDALRVRRNVHLDYYEQGVRGQSWIIETDWYAPSIGQVARRETTSRYWRIATNDGGYRFVRVRGGDDRDGNAFPRLEQDDWLVFELSAYTR